MAPPMGRAQIALVDLPQPAEFYDDWTNGYPVMANLFEAPPHFLWSTLNQTSCVCVCV